MEQDSTKTDANSTMLFIGDAWFDPIEAERVNDFGFLAILGRVCKLQTFRGRDPILMG